MGKGLNRHYPKKTYRWLTNTWKDAQHHSILEKCKSKLQWDITSHWSECPSSKSLWIIYAGEAVEETLYTVDGTCKLVHPLHKDGGSLWNWKAAAASHELQGDSWPLEERRLDHSKILCNKVLLKYKGIEEASDTDFRRGQNECPPC